MFGQLDALKVVGTESVFAGKTIGTVRSGPELDNLLDQMRKRGAITVTKCVRPRVPWVLNIVDTIQLQGAGFRSLAEDGDTKTPAWRLVFQAFATIAYCPVSNERQADLICKLGKGR